MIRVPGSKKNTQVQVSIIIAAYNAAETIADTLQSLLDQTFSEWEAIVVDDGSSDKTAEIILSFIEKDKRFKLLKQENLGESGARNSGIKLANYDWMLFLDSDDWILPGHLESLTKKIITEPALDTAYCGWAYVTPDDHFIFDSISRESGDLFAQHAGYCFSIVHTYLVRSSLVKEACGFDLSLRTCADWDMWQRIARTGAKFGAVPEVLAIYRIRAGSATRDGYQLFKDGLRVINQGHTGDERVKRPSPLHINGYADRELSKRKFELACACAGYQIGSGKKAAPVLALLEDARSSNLDPYSMALCLYRHIMIASSRPLSDWAKEWNNFSESANEYLIQLESISGTPNLANKAGNILRYLSTIYSNEKGFWSGVKSFRSRFLLEVYKLPIQYRFLQFYKRIKKLFYK